MYTVHHQEMLVISFSFQSFKIWWDDGDNQLNISGGHLEDMRISVTLKVISISLEGTLTKS